MKQIRLTVFTGFYRNTPFHYVNPKRQLNRERFSGSQHYLSVSDFLLFAKLDVLMRVGSRVTTCNDPDESIAGLAEPKDTRGANSKGGFFSESAISFSNLQISKKKYSKKLS